MGHHLQMIAATCIWVGMMWVLGAMLHFGYKQNPYQPKIRIGGYLTRLMTLGKVEGEVAIAPTFFQLNNLLFLIGALVEYSLTDWKTPVWTIRIWFIAQVIGSIVFRVIGRSS